MVYEFVELSEGKRGLCVDLESRSKEAVANILKELEEGEGDISNIIVAYEEMQGTRPMMRGMDATEFKTTFASLF